MYIVRENGKTNICKVFSLFLGIFPFSYSLIQACCLLYSYINVYKRKRFAWMITLIVVGERDKEHCGSKWSLPHSQFFITCASHVHNSQFFSTIKKSEWQHIHKLMPCLVFKCAARKNPIIRSSIRGALKARDIIQRAISPWNKSKCVEMVNAFEI